MAYYLLGAVVAIICFVLVSGIVRGALRSTATSPPRPNDMSVHNKGRGFGHVDRSPFTAAGVGNVLVTPTVTNVSALGASPLVLSLSDGNYVAGKYLQWEFAGSLTPAKNADGSYTTTTQKGVTFIDGDSWARLDLALGYSTPSGAFAFHCRVLQDNPAGVVTVTDQLGATNTYDGSAFSADYTDTIAVTSTVLDAAHRNTNNAIIGSGTFGANLRLTAIAQGAAQCARTTNHIPDGSKYYWEMTVTALKAASNLYTGTSDDLFVWNTFQSPPQNSHGAGLGDGWTGFPSAVGTGWAVAANDVIMCCAKRTGLTIRTWMGRNGTWIGDPSAETGGETFTTTGTDFFGFVGCKNDVDTADVNFGQSNFTYAKPTGATPWA